MIVPPIQLELHIYIHITKFWEWWLTRQNCEVIENTQTHVKTSSKLTILINNHELKIIVVNKGQIHRELMHF